MNREELEDYIIETYGAQPEHLWTRCPNYAVFRHGHNRKWFAAVMDIPRVKLGLEGSELIAVVNVKCDPLLVGSLREEAGIFPAYHMSKANWVTVVLDGSVPSEKIRWLLALSHELTAGKRKQREGERQI